MATATARIEQGNTNSAVLFLAFELSHKTWKLGFTTGYGQKPRQRTISARDLAKLSEEIAAAKRRFELPEATRVVSCYEAGRDGFWLHRALNAAGVENLVVDSSSIEVKRRARRAKSDGLDVGKLITMLMRYHGGESKVWSVVRVPDVEAEDRRHLERDLTELKAERSREVNRIKGLLASQGIVVSARGWAPVDVGALRLWDGTSVAEGLRERIERAQARWAFIDSQIRELEAQRAEELRHGERADTKQVRALMRLRGVGVNTASVLVKELLGWRRFENRRQVGALAGLAPTPYQSGESAREQGISKSGNRHVRAKMVEMAWMWVRYNAGSALSRWFQERFGQGGSRQRRIGIVALARKLLIALWRYLETGEIPLGAALKG